MKTHIRTLFYILFIFTLLSCREDKGNESMPLNKIKGVLNLYRFPEALRDSKAAIAVSPEKPEYHLVAAHAHFALGNYFECIKATEKAESLGLQDPELPALQARVYWETGDTSRSALYINRVNELVPFHSGINLLKGKQAAAKGDTLKAVTFFLSSVRTDRGNIDAYRDLVKIYMNRGKDDSALYYCIQAKEVNPHHPDFYYAEGRIFYKKEMKQSAVASYKYCLKEDSAYAPAMYQLGKLYYREGNPIEAYNYLRKYSTFNNDNKEVYKIMITILTEQNKEVSTIPYYERLIQLDSTDIGLKYKLQKLYNQYAVSTRIDTASNTPVANRVTPVVSDTTRRRRVVRDTTTRRPAPVVSDTVR